MKYCKLLTLLLLATYACNYAVAQEVVEPSKNILKQKSVLVSSVINANEQASNALPDGFPVRVDTGNKEADDENYRVAKEQWIEENPLFYEQMVSKSKLSKEENEKIRSSEREQNQINPSK